MLTDGFYWAKHITTGQTTEMEIRTLDSGGLEARVASQGQWWPLEVLEIEFKIESEPIV
jgi:hypothetical protein